MGSMNTLGLRRDDLPATCIAAADASSAGRRRTRSLIALELVCLVVAAGTGIAVWRVGRSDLDVLAGIGCLGFAAALASASIRRLRKPEMQWHSGRAAAESIRTLAWRYAAGGDPFPLSESNAKCTADFLGRLQAIFAQLEGIPLSAQSASAREITPAMNALRSAEFELRRQVYGSDRIDHQVTWYSQRSADHLRAGRIWFTVSVGAAGTGIILATFRFFGAWDIDFLGLGASVAGAAIAWNQLNQHQAVGNAYALTARELSMIRDQLTYIGPESWSAFVSDAEGAISREHTMWLARHGATTT